MYHVEVLSNGKSSYKVKGRNGEFILDSEGKGIAPLEALLSGLGGCVGVYLRRFLELNKITTDFVITIEAELDKTPPIGFKNIDLNIDLKGLKIDERKIGQLMDVVKKCPAHHTMKNNPNINFKLI